mmetsp:Transcript_98081/g.211518  ORF Transcript_98081/g.211518 Transcript_98081/m.211518 type:complete len:301 (-) Transcript_98081:41-943(-)
MRLASWRLAALLLGASSAGLASAQFQLPKIDTSQITQHVNEATKKIGEAIKDNTPPDVHKAAEAIKDAGKDAGSKALNALDLQGKVPVPANVSEALKGAEGAVKVAGKGAEGAQGNLAHAMRTAAEALNKGATAVSNSSASEVQDALQSAGTAAGKAAGAAAGQVDGAEPGDLAKVLQDKAGQAANVLNSTGLQVAKALESATPKAAEALKQAGTKPDDTDRESQSVHTLLEDSAGSSAWRPLVMCVLLVVAAVGGWQGYIFLNGRGPRSPNLLSDGDIGMQMRGGSVRVNEEQGFFTQF